MCDTPLGEPFDDTESELVSCCAEKGAKEPRPPSEAKPWVSQHPALFVTDVLRANVLRVLYASGHDVLEELPLIALAQILLQTLEVSSMEPFVGSAADPVNAGVFSQDSSPWLAVLRVSLLPLPGYSSRSHRQGYFCFCLGVSQPSPPRQPALSRRRNPFFCLHIISTTAAWGNPLEVVFDHSLRSCFGTGDTFTNSQSKTTIALVPFPVASGLTSAVSCVISSLKKSRLAATPGFLQTDDGVAHLLVHANDLCRLAPAVLAIRSHRPHFLGSDDEFRSCSQQFEPRNQEVLRLFQSFTASPPKILPQKSTFFRSHNKWSHECECVFI